jgi:dTMP kinase
MTSRPVPRNSFALVTRGPFARLWWASVIGSTGDWITIFATISLGHDIAGGQGVLVAVFARILPGLVFGGAVGVLSDRADRRRLIVLADLGRAAIVPTLIFASSLPLLVAITVVSEFLSMLGQSPRAAVVPNLVDEEHLVNANSLILGATYGTIPVGAGFNWVLASLPRLPFGFIPEETAPFALAFIVDSATFLVSGLIVATLPALRTKVARAIADADGDVPSTREDLVAGGLYLWRTRSVRRVIASMTASLFGGAVIIAVGPKFVERTLLASTTGFFAVVTALGAGAGLGIMLVSLYGARLTRRDVVFAFATLLTGAGLVAASLTSTVFGASAWIFVMGLGAGAGYVMGLTHLHEEVGDEMRGRVFAALFALMRIGIFVSMLVAVPYEGALSQAGVDGATRIVLLSGGATIAAAGLTTLWSLRHLLRRPKMAAETRELLEETTRAVRRASRRDNPGDEAE